MMPSIQHDGRCVVAMDRPAVGAERGRRVGKYLQAIQLNSNSTRKSSVDTRATRLSHLELWHSSLMHEKSKTDFGGLDCLAKGPWRASIPK